MWRGQPTKFIEKNYHTFWCNLDNVGTRLLYGCIKFVQLLLTDFTVTVDLIWSHSFSVWILLFVWFMFYIWCNIPTYKFLVWQIFSLSCRELSSPSFKWWTVFADHSIDILNAQLYQPFGTSLIWMHYFIEKRLDFLSTRYTNELCTLNLMC